MKRYEIRWAALDPVRRSEMARTRPVVIVSMDVLNAQLRTVTVCPLTTQLHPAWRGRRLGLLTEGEAKALRRLITEMYGE